MKTQNQAQTADEEIKQKRERERENEMEKKEAKSEGMEQACPKNLDLVVCLKEEDEEEEVLFRFSGAREKN